MSRRASTYHLNTLTIHTYICNSHARHISTRHTSALHIPAYTLHSTRLPSTLPPSHKRFIAIRLATHNIKTSAGPHALLPRPKRTLGERTLWRRNTAHEQAGETEMKHRLVHSRHCGRPFVGRRTCGNRDVRERRPEAEPIGEMGNSSLRRNVST